jgi:tRNA pseudouridine13 synthase
LEDLPFLTEDHPGTGGRIKAKPQDFVVEEIPLYEPSGEGQHVYVGLEKRGLSTYQAISSIARQLGVPTRQIGYAGLKDARAVTRQMISIDGVDPARVEALDLPGVKILWVDRHRNKLKIGHLAGNRFTIRRNTHRLGQAMLRGDANALAHEYLGGPQPGDPPLAQAARRAFDAGDYQTALAKWPASQREERRVLEAAVRHGGDVQRGLRLLDKKLRRLFVSAYQSYLFNCLLAARIQALDRLELGDVAFIHASGAAFLVKDPAIEQPRADRFEISPSGPLYGPKVLLAEGRPGQQEQDLLVESGLALDKFRLPGIKLKGARRPYRVPLTEVQIGWDGGLMLSFRLPPGSYATEVLREVMKA